MEKVIKCFVHKSYTFDIETQNLNVRSNTKLVLEMRKMRNKNFLEPDAFSDKQYFKN